MEAKYNTASIYRLEEEGYQREPPSNALSDQPGLSFQQHIPQASREQNRAGNAVSYASPLLAP